MPETEPGTVVHRIGARGRVRIDVARGDIRVDPVDGDECWVVARYPASSDGPGDDPISDGVLRVEPAEAGLVVTVGHSTLVGALSGKRKSGNGAAVDVTVHAPRGATIAITSVRARVGTLGIIGEQAIRTVTGDVSVSGAAGPVKIDTISGRVAVQGTNVAPTISTTSGAVIIRAAEIDGTRIDTVSADVDVEGRLAITREHRISTVNGDLRLGSASGYSVMVRAVSGSIKAQIPARRDDGKGGRRVVVGDGRADVLFRTVSGDLVLRAAVTDTGVARMDRDEVGILALLESLERGDIDVDEASRRLAVANG